MGVDEVFDQAKKATVFSLKPYLDMTRTGDKPAGQFRVKWLRRLLLAWWWIAALLTGFSLCFDLLVLLAGNIHFRPNSDAAMLLYYVQVFAGSLGVTGLFFDLWVVAALFFLSNVWQERAQGRREKAKIWRVVAAVAIVMGRPSTFLTMFLFSFIPNSWWLLWPIKYGLLPPVALLISGAINLFTFYLAFTLFILTVVLLPIKIYQALFNISNTLFLSNAQRTLFFGTLVQFWYWFTGNELPQVDEEPDDSKGARFASPKEIAALFAADGMAFGHVGGTPFLLQNEKHVLIMASTRSGKGVSLIIPHLLRYPGSTFVLDPKGENAKATGRQRAALGGKVLYLDPFGISGKPKARFNPLSRFTPENMEAESKALAAALVMGERGVRDHWTGSAQQLLAALILHVVTTPSLLPKERDLGMVRRLLLQNINGVFKLMLESDAAEGLLSRLAASFLQTPEKEFGSILSTAQRETEILDNPFIVASLAASGPGEEVDFADWHKGTMSVFLCLSAPKFPVFNRWLRLVLTSALDEMTDSLNLPTRPVCFMLDELATLGHLQAVENAVGLAAGYGIQLVTVFQDVAQMRDLYKGRWSSFIGNAGVRAVFSLDDYETAHYWSQFMGGRLVETMSQQQDIYGMTKGQSRGEAMRPLRSPEQLMLEFAKDKMLVLPQGSRPIVTERVAYFHDQTLAGLWDDPRETSPVRPEKPKPKSSRTKKTPIQAAPGEESQTTPPVTPCPSAEGEEAESEPILPENKAEKPKPAKKRVSKSKKKPKEPEKRQFEEYKGVIKLHRD